MHTHPRTPQYPSPLPSAHAVPIHAPPPSPRPERASRISNGTQSRVSDRASQTRASLCEALIQFGQIGICTRIIQSFDLQLIGHHRLTNMQHHNHRRKMAMGMQTYLRISHTPNSALMPLPESCKLLLGLCHSERCIRDEAICPVL